MDVVRDPRFWYGYLAGAFGQRGPSLDADVLSACLGVDEDAAHRWWNEFTGWYEGVLDEADGQVDEPGLVELPLEGGDLLVVEAHPGDTYVRRRRSSSEPQDLIANFGPHWWLPDWTLAGAGRLAGTNPFAFMVLAPLVRLGLDEDRAVAEEVFGSAAIQSGILDPASAVRLAREWCRCAAALE
jgi:hypothetical protein